MKMVTKAATNMTLAGNVVVFSDISMKAGTTDSVSKAQMKAFMSSKISKLSTNTENPPKSNRTPKEEEEERTNLQNDALLHKLVHTKLLSGSMNTELDLTPAKKRKAFAGRILELTGDVKLGKGEKEIRVAERNKASKRVREGIAGKQKERSKQELEEAKNLGNYHQSLKKVFEASSSISSNRNRQKGLGMGVGKFSNGLLRLSQADVNKAAMETSDSFRGRRGFGRGRGRGGFKKHR
ncbi:hypothetical protein CPB83DRAFT_830979 [Crepidotus variabilis]|uniref:Uncharacterized protein n=1 Tax=Crepidotus variabilis TaxID=179855 RepID=A0A9P6ERM6_9AGAR|nr:hypothetical protein CPB83DRAFT_830979 [Crepidotus variabilis]